MARSQEGRKCPTSGQGGRVETGVSGAPTALSRPTHSARWKGLAEAEMLEPIFQPSPSCHLVCRCAHTRLAFHGAGVPVPRQVPGELGPHILEKSSPGWNPMTQLTANEPALGENLKILSDNKVMLEMSGKLFLNFNIQKTGKVLLGQRRCPEAFFSSRIPTSKISA